MAEAGRAIWPLTAAAILGKGSAAPEVLLIGHEVVGGLMPRIADWLLNRPLETHRRGGNRDVNTDYELSGLRLGKPMNTQNTGALTAQNIITHAQSLAATPVAERTLAWHVAAAHVGHMNALSALTTRM